MPDWLSDIDWVRAGTAAGAIALGLAIGWIAGWLGGAALVRVMAQARTKVGEAAARRSRRPLSVVGLLLGLQASLAPAGAASGVDDAIVAGVRQGVGIALIIATAWLVLAAVNGIEAGVVEKYDVSIRDNRQARKMRTQVQLLTRAVEIFIVIVALALVLMSFEPVRRLGASLLTGAGLAGLVLGFAAKPVLSNLIAGIQIALTEPFAIDDVVIVEGEWGRIEQITTTYVVVRIWDDRRLIIPLTYLIENPFQNWTRRTSELLGTVFLWADHRVDVDALREELKRVCEGSDKWDRRVCLVQVTDTSEGGVQCRALVSAANSGDLWDLRCLVRERLVRHLDERQESAIPRTRVELYDDGEGSDGSPDAPGAPRRRSGRDSRAPQVGGQREIQGDGDGD